MNATARMALGVRRYGAAPGSHHHDHAQVLWSLRGTLELDIEGRGMRLVAGQSVLRRPTRPQHPQASHHRAAYRAHALAQPEPPAAALLAMLPAHAWSPAVAAARARRDATTNRRPHARIDATLRR